MAVLNIRFSKGFMGIGAKNGQIRIANPTEVIKFTQQDIRPDKTITHPLQGDWSGFPQGLVSRMDVVAQTDRDYTWGKILVNGEAEGSFNDITMYIWHANKETRARFDLFDMKGNLKWDTPFFIVQAQMIGGGISKVAGASSIVGATGEFAAKILEITQGSHASGDIPITVWFDVQSVPEETSSLSLAFVTNQEWPQGAKAWAGAGKYDFTANIWSGHRNKLGRPDGKAESILAILRAKTDQGIVIGELKEEFTLDQVKFNI